MSTSTQDREFGGAFLQDIIEWIAGNIRVEEVFENNEIKEYVEENFPPEDVYGEGTLIDWAEKNGWVKEQ